jgi:hypothetical protein
LVILASTNQWSQEEIQSACLLEREQQAVVIIILEEYFANCIYFP